jgi:hypothetical protein
VVSELIKYEANQLNKEADALANKREINRRDGDGLTVIAYWLVRENIVLIQVDDKHTKSSAEFIAPNDQVMDRFNHAFVYADMKPYPQEQDDAK